MRIKHVLDNNVQSQLTKEILKKAVIEKPYLGGNTHHIIRCGELNWTNYRQDNIIISIEGIAACLLCSNDSTHGIKIYDDRNKSNPTIRRVTPLESFRLMGFADDDYDRCRYRVVNGNKVDNVKEVDLYVQAGNSIVVTVLMAIFGVLYGVEDLEEKVYRERLKMPEQLVCELPLFNYMREHERDAD